METKKGAYPTKTIYEITEFGKVFFDKMQIEAFNGLFPSFLGFKLGLKFNARLTSQKIILYANRAIKEIDNRIEEMISFQNDKSTSDEYKFFIEHDIMLFRQERKWIEMVTHRYNK